MTRREAIKYIKSKMCGNCGVYLGGGKCLDNCDVIEIIQALSQEHILDKIRTEINQYQSDYDPHGTEYDRTAWTSFNKCLQIIDKYNVETERNDE